MMLRHEFTMKENLRFSGDGGDEDKSCWGVSLPSVVSGGSDTFVIDSTTVSKQRRTILENFKMLSYSQVISFLNINTPHSLRNVHHIFTDRTMDWEKKRERTEGEILFCHTNSPTNINVLIVINWQSNAIMSQYFDTIEKPEFLYSEINYHCSWKTPRILEATPLQMNSVTEQVPQLELSCSMDMTDAN